MRLRDRTHTNDEQHQEINASEDEKLECVLMRSDSEAIAVNLPDVEPVEKPETVKWIDPTHPE